MIVSVLLHLSLSFSLVYHFLFLPEVISEYNALNLGSVDRKVQSDMHFALTRAVEISSKFTTQMSTFHSYLEQVREESVTKGDRPVPSSLSLHDDGACLLIVTVIFLQRCKLYPLDTSKGLQMSAVNRKVR